MRIFTSVNFDEETKRRLLAVQDRIRKEAGRGKFPPRENFHLTLVFLGETSEERLPEIKDAIVQAASSGEKPRPAFELSFSRAGFFKRGAKELWRLDSADDPDGTERLAELQRALASELLTRGFIIDPRPFTPHITLGREIKNGPWPFKTENIAIPVKRISLMQSRHIPADSAVRQKQVFAGRRSLAYVEIFGYPLD